MQRALDIRARVCGDPGDRRVAEPHDGMQTTEGPDERPRRRGARLPEAEHALGAVLGTGKQEFGPQMRLRPVPGWEREGRCQFAADPLEHDPAGATGVEVATLEHAEDPGVEGKSASPDPTTVTA